MYERYGPPIMSLRSVFTASLLLFSTSVLAHGGHGQPPIPPDADWVTRHMAQEHHIQGFDGATFFKLHALAGNDEWSFDDIKRMYGLFDTTTDHIPHEMKEQAVNRVLAIFDTDGSHTITQEEFLQKWNQGVKLPDLGFGPGHHGDSEYEYEIHHFEQHHGDDAKEEDLTHPEDIEHFKQHDQEEAQEAEWERVSSAGIVEKNIPQKFLRSS